MKTTISAIAILVAMSAAANAACSPSVSGIPDGVSIDVAGCHLQVQNPTVIPTHQGGGIEVLVRDPNTGEIGSDGGNITGELDRQIEHDAAQDNRLDKHKKAIIANYGWDLYQQGMLNDHKSRIGSLEEVTSAHEGRLNAHDAILSQHSATLDDHAKGLAIAMSLPDAWLSDKKRFGIFGSVGGFDDETAIGFAAIGRIDETWSVNAKLGSDIEFGHVGWQVGAGAQW